MLQERLLTCEFVDTPSRLSAREMSESTSWYVLGGGKYDGIVGSCIIPSILLPWSVTATDKHRISSLAGKVCVCLCVCVRACVRACMRASIYMI